MKPVHVKASTYIDFGIKNNEEDLKFKITDQVRLSKYKNIFAKGYATDLSEGVFVTKQVKNAVPWTYVIEDLNGKKIVRTVYEKELLKTNQEEFTTEKVIKKKGDKLYLQWKGYDNSFNSQIDKKDIFISYFYELFLRTAEAQ